MQGTFAVDDPGDHRPISVAAQEDIAVPEVPMDEHRPLDLSQGGAVCGNKLADLLR